MALLMRVIALTAVLLLALATTASAAGHRTVAVCSSPAPSVSGIVKAWDAGATSHVQGWAASYEASGDVLCAGTVEVVADLQLSPGLGGLHGTVIYRLAHIDGGWSGTFEQQWAFDKGLLTYGREVARGFGALAGWQLRATLSEAFDGTIVETDEIFAPGS